MTTEHRQSVAWSPTPPVELSAEQGLWATRGYRWLWFVSLLLGAGYGLTMSSQSQFWEEVDFSYSTIAWIAFANGLGVVLGYLVAVMFSDRRSKRQLTSRCALALSSMSAVVALLALGDLLRGDWFYFVAALFGMVHGVATAVVLGWVGELLPRRLIAKGVVVLSIASLPLGVLIAIPGAFQQEERYAVMALFAGSFVLYLAAFATVRKVPVAVLPGEGRKTAPEGLKAAAMYLWTDARLRALCLYILVVGVLSHLLHAGLTVHLLGGPDSDIESYGWSLLARGLAGFVATICLAFVIGGPSRWALLLLAAAVSGVTVIAVSLTTNLALMIILLIPQGAAMTVILLGSQALALSATRTGYFGRVAALLLFVVNLLHFASGFAREYLYDWFDGRWSVLAIGLLLTIAAAWLYRQWRSFRLLPEDPDPASKSPDAAYASAPFLADRQAPQKIGAADLSSFSRSGSRDGQDSGSRPE